jgi:DHA2 family multidrug resistance protein
MPRSLAMAVALPISGRLYNRIGPKFLIGAGLFLNAVSFYQLSILSLDVGFWDILFPQFLQGVGFGMIFVSLSTAALSTIEKNLLTAAAGLYNVVRQVFGSVGIALAATILIRGENFHRARLMEHITIFSDKTINTLNSLTHYFYSRGMDMADAQSKALKAIEGIVMRQASMISFNYVFFLIAVLFALSIPLIFLITDPQRDMNSQAIGEPVSERRA